MVSEDASISEHAPGRLSQQQSQQETVVGKATDMMAEDTVLP